MPNYLRSGVVALAIAAIACAQPNGPEPVATELPVESLLSDDFTGFENAERRVIRNVIEWTIAWERVHRNYSPKPPLPAIDFTREQIILVALGERRTSGYSVHINGASSNGDETTVRLESWSPGPACITLDVITFPIDLAKMPRTTGRVVFEEDQTVRPCR